MDETQAVPMLIETTTSKIQQLEKAFAELEGQRAVSLNLKWKALEEHFHDLERSLKKRFEELEEKEKAFEARASEAKEMLEKREAAVNAKEEASLDRVQDQRDAALSAIEEAFQKCRKESPEPIIVESNNGMIDASPESKPTDSKASEVGSPGIEPRPQLKKFCEEMDAKGLHKFISENRKALAAMREEVPAALKCATDPAQLVLDSLEGFYGSEQSGQEGKRDSNLLGLRRTCIMLMESLFPLLADIDSGSISDHPIILPEVKEKAKEIAEEWKPKLDELDMDANVGNSLEAHAFLQLLATFGITSEFDQDEICKLLPSVCRRRQTPELCRALGLSEKMPAVIEVLINAGRQLEAVNLAYAFDLTEQFAPVPLLKTYLKEVRKSSQGRGGSSPAAALNEASERELSALKAVIKCIEEHKLEEQYPIDPLQKRIAQLEKAKADKRRAVEASKPQSKRPRANGISYAPRPTVQEKVFYRAPERYPYGTYDRPGQDLYAQSTLQRPYLYAPENHGSPLLGTLGSYNISPNHGSYYGNGYQYQSPYLH
ncbi:hypothetical protein AMTRI_Chr06g201150 [Amborella trichopoda]|uniref:FRIGIDA-like protein n=1 Tax=Amborella trichopoda TaxID=13333 RepID=U5DI16_AMBTC|nr:FRIGIDA-like protein 3 [Amborella trichopoda]ERN20213.1 hypothetical protein AMTR_s00066p00134410 [Amborella trichopoda]|eukprot:XP_006858746.1 FRIGIDA-like protein 3 [Amborella trichopoda]